MSKAPSAEIGRNRYYHYPFAYDGGPCPCSPAKPDKDCPYTLPSVTTILQTLPKPWLGAWAAKMVAQTALDEIDSLAAMLSQEGREAVERYLKGAPWRKRDTAAALGTLVHESAEQGASAEDVPANAKARVLAWHRWLDDWQPVIECQELTVYQPHGKYRYAGTLDLLVNVRGERWLIDIKSGSWGWEARLQQAAYRYAAIDANGNPPPRIDHVGILDLKDDGYAFYEIEAGMRELKAFLTAAELAKAVERFGAEPKGSLLVL